MQIAAVCTQQMILIYIYIYICVSIYWSLCVGYDYLCVWYQIRVLAKPCHPCQTLGKFCVAWNPQEGAEGPKVP